MYLKHRRHRGNSIPSSSFSCTPSSVTLTTHEIQAECTLINFTVTAAGLEDQLLSLVVRKERLDLAELDEQLVAPAEFLHH